MPRPHFAIRRLAFSTALLLPLVGCGLSSNRRSDAQAIPSNQQPSVALEHSAIAVQNNPRGLPTSDVHCNPTAHPTSDFQGHLMPPHAPAAPAPELGPAPALVPSPAFGTTRPEPVIRLATFQEQTTELPTQSNEPGVLPVAPSPPEVISNPDSSTTVDMEAAFADSIPIDLAAALELAGGRNPQVAFAAQRIEEAVADLRLAEILWVPSLRAGMNYNKHEGQIQDVVGNMIETSRGSVYTGFGAQAVGAGSPAIPGVAVNFHVRDAIFQPRIAEHVVGARMESSRATLHDTLLQTALAYIDLLEAVQIYAVSHDTLRNAERLAELTGSFARTGEGLLADADRAQVELSLRRIEMRRATESVKVASARLARLLSQPQGPAMIPQEPGLAAIELVELDVPLQELVAIGLTNRPELGESQFLVGEAVQRLRREYQAPLLPSVLMGLSYGGNGGGLGSDIENFGDRLDFDATAYWELRNLGLGERRARAGAEARVESARLRQIQMLDQVASEIAEFHAQVTERKAQIELAQLGVQSAADSYRRNSERIREGEGLPIETLQSIQALDQARRQSVRAVSDYNRAQFQLQRALGWPITPP